MVLLVEDDDDEEDEGDEREEEGDKEVDVATDVAHDGSYCNVVSFCDAVFCGVMREQEDRRVKP